MVGCVLVRDDRVIGQGYHRYFGGPHAEVDALASLPDPSLARGTTAYVTLEPCCHHGKTPPCSEALIRAGVARVVVAMRDPFPKVDGGGIRQLAAAGIEVVVGVLEREAEQLNAPYLKRLTTGLPWTIAKWAMTADGRIATAGGQSQWITGPRAREHVHRLRRRVDAIIVGMGTVAADDPMLNVRLPEEDADVADNARGRTAKRVVLCHRRLPSPEAKLIRTADQIPTWLFVSPKVDPRRLADVEATAAVVIRLDTGDRRKMIARTLAHLGRAEMTNVMVEGGGELLGSFFGPGGSQCYLDECHVYLGAKLFGGAKSPGPIAGAGIASIIDAPALTLQQCDVLDDDVRLIYRRLR
jgi:diaminohydroxyphosphoribosylaminopyrimidine deaminase/5-amino-6-(5-phosphoribosylamino)uracil reductase